MEAKWFRHLAPHGRVTARAASLLVAVCLGACDFASEEDATEAEGGPDAATAPADAATTPIPDDGGPGGEDFAPPAPDLGTAPPADAGTADAGPPDLDGATVDAGGRPPDAGVGPIARVPEAVVGTCADAPVARLGGAGDDGAPVLAATADAIGVLWTRAGDAPGVRFARLAFDGTVISPVRTLTETAVDPAWPPALLAVDDGFLAAWTERRGDERAVIALRLAADGAPAGPPVQLSAAGADVGAPTLVQTVADDVAVAWHEASGGTERIALARLSTDGGVLDPPTGVVFDPAGARQPRLAAGEAGLGLVWLAPRDRAQHLLYAPLGPSGVPAAEPLALAAGGYAGGGGLVAIPGGFVAAWHEFREGDSEIFVRRIGGAEVQVTRESVRPTTPIAVRASGGLAVVWQEERTGLRGLFAARLDPDGGRVAEVRVTCGDSDATQPALTTAADGFAVAWSAVGPDGRDVFVSVGRLPFP